MIAENETVLIYLLQLMAERGILPMIGKLLGHTQVQTTTRYAHLARDTVKASAARIGDSIESDLGAKQQVSSGRP